MLSLPINFHQKSLPNLLKFTGDFFLFLRIFGADCFYTSLSYIQLDGRGIPEFLTRLVEFLDQYWDEIPLLFELSILMDDDASLEDMDPDSQLRMLTQVWANNSPQLGAWSGHIPGVYYTARQLTDAFEVFPELKQLHLKGELLKMDEDWNQEDPEVYVRKLATKLGKLERLVIFGKNMSPIFTCSIQREPDHPEIITKLEIVGRKVSAPVGPG
jgi:hypothetical protein